MSWDKYIIEGITAAAKADYTHAEQALKRALHHAKENFSRADGRLALNLSLLGHVYFKTRDFTRAERLLEQSLRLHTLSENSLNEPCVVMDCFSLGEIKKHVGKSSEACAVYDETLNTLRTSGGYEIKAIKQATERFEELLRVTRKESGEHKVVPPPKSAVVETPSAKEEPQPVCFEQAAIEKMQAVWHQQLHKGLAALNHEDEEPELLISAYLNIESACRLAQNIFEIKDVRLIATLKALADAATKLKLYPQAERIYHQAIVAVKAGGKETETSIHAVRAGLALMYVDANRFDDARAVLAEEEIPQPIRETPAYANFCKRLEKAEECLRVHAEAESLMEQASEAERAGDFEKASKMVNNALSKLRQSFPPDHPENARLLRYRADLLRKSGEGEKADELMARVQRIERSIQAAAADWAKLTEELPMPAVC